MHTRTASIASQMVRTITYVQPGMQNLPEGLPIGIAQQRRR